LNALIRILVNCLEIEKDISEILEESKNSKKDNKEEEKTGRAEDHDGDTGKPEDRDEEDVKSNVYEDDINLKEHTEGYMLTKSNKVYTDSHIKGSDDTDFMSFEQGRNLRIFGSLVWINVQMTKWESIIWTTLSEIKRRKTSRQLLLILYLKE
jgi:hypothetical protein